MIGHLTTFDARCPVARQALHQLLGFTPADQIRRESTRDRMLAMDAFNDRTDITRSQKMDLYVSRVMNGSAQ